MKVKTNELTGAALNWAVAKCEGRADPIYRYGDSPQDFYISGPQRQGPFNPSTDWAQGGPIIEREGLHLSHTPRCGWFAHIGIYTAEGPTPLIAAMRCRVASKMGDYVDVPEELV